VSLTEIWSRLTPGNLTAAALTADGAVLGDDRGLLLVVDAAGEVTSEHPFPAPIHDVAVLGDTIAVAAGEDEVILLDAGRVKFRFSSEGPVRRVALGPQADYLLAMGPAGDGVFLNRYGREMKSMRVEGGVASLAIVPRNGQIMTANREGLVTASASWGKPLWHVDLRRSAGDIATDRNGRMVLIPVMSFGVEALTGTGASIGAYDVGEPAIAAACSGDGETILLATSTQRLVLLRKDASVVSSDVFPSPIQAVAVSSDGRRALVTTGSGYAHLMALGMRGEGPLLELTENAPAARAQYRLCKRVFSPYSMVLRTCLSFAPDSAFLVIGGDRRKVQVLDLDGNVIATRRYGGTLLDLTVTGDGDVRVFASQSVFRFRSDEDGSIPEWVGVSDLSQVIVRPDGGALGLTDDGFIVAFSPERGNGRRLFPVSDPDTRGILTCDDAIALSHRSGLIRVLDLEGNPRGEWGPWAAEPDLIAAQDGVGFLMAIRKLLILIGSDGEERWRHHLPASARTGLAVPGAFVVIDETGTAHVVTASGVIRPAFSVGSARVTAYPDAGEGPGFLLTSDCMLTRVRPNGEPAFRFRTPDTISFVRSSPDGLYAGVFSGVDLYVFPLIEDADELDGADTAHRYLEIRDG